MRPRGNALDPAQMLNYGLLIFGVVSAILVGAAILQHLRRLYFAADEPDDVLASLQDAFDAGELDEAEFHRVRASLERTPSEGPSDGAPKAPGA